MLCHSCGECLLEHSKSVFVCQTCSKDFSAGEVLYFCLKCKKEDKHEHKLSKLKNAPGEVHGAEEEKKQYLESLLDEYYNLDFEDLIGGGQIKTRFKYHKVAADSFGLTEDEILLLDDKQLNKLVSLKKYRPYIGSAKPPEDDGQYVSAVVKRKEREIGEAVDLDKVSKMKRRLEGELKEKRRALKQSLKATLTEDKDRYFKREEVAGPGAEKLGKNKKRKDKYREKKGEAAEEEGAEDKKRKRMALYGI
jgi:protein KRI1